MKIGTLLKELRNKNNLNQSDIASKLNVTPATYSRYENDQLEPSLDKLLELSIILKEDPSIFFRSELLTRNILKLDDQFTEYSYLFVYWQLEEQAKILNLKRSTLSLPEMNRLASEIKRGFEILKTEEVIILKNIKPETFEEFLKRKGLEWLVNTNETSK